jgi:hypothetical protein
LPPRPIAKLSKGTKMTGAGDGNRTHVRSLGSFYSAIELRPPKSSKLHQTFTLRNILNRLPNHIWSQLLVLGLAATFYFAVSLRFSHRTQSIQIAPGKIVGIACDPKLRLFSAERYTHHFFSSSLTSTKQRVAEEHQNRACWPWSANTKMTCGLHFRHFGREVGKWRVTCVPWPN